MFIEYDDNINRKVKCKGKVSMRINANVIFIDRDCNQLLMIDFVCFL